MSGEGASFYVLLLVLCVSLACPVLAAAAPKDFQREQAEVLFLSSADPDLPDIDGLIEETEVQILESRSTPVHFSLEYFGPAVATGGAAYQEKLLSLFEAKYRGHSFELIIVIGDDTLNFARAARARLFPDASILFFLSHPENFTETFLPGKGETGVIRKLNFLPTLQVALRQNPETRHVIVVCGSSDSEKLELRTAQEQFRSYESGVDLQYWTGPELRELAERLSNVQPNSVVLFLNFLEDRDGERFTPNRALRTVARGANRPIYGTFLSFVGSGAVGGHVADLREIGGVLGRTGVRILNGERAETIPVATGEFQRYVFDWRQLHRWHIPEDQLPPASSVLYWEQSSWERYRWSILGLAALVCVQMLLIILFVASRIKRKRIEEDLRRQEAERKRTEQELKKSEEKFAKAFRQSPLAVALTDAKTHRYIEVNDTFEHFSGYRRDELIGHTVLEKGIWVNGFEREAVAKKLAREGRLRDVEFAYRRKDGEVRVAQGSAELIDVDGQACMLGMAVDITDRKRAEQALRESEKRFRLMANSAPILMWLSGPDSLFTDCNQEWLRFTGRSIEEELGTGWTHIIHPEDLSSCMEEYKSASAARESFTMECRLRRSDGEYRWMLSRAVPRFLDDGEFAGYIGCCVDITDEKEARTAQAELSGRLIHAQEQERVRIARELHDDINQRLALLANGLEELQRSSAKFHDVTYQREMQQLWQLTSEIANDLQDLSHQLHPSKLHYMGLGPAVGEICHEFAKQHRIETECTVHEVPRDLDENISLAFFRIVQESLRNAGKHSQARHVKVELNGEGEAVRLRISDDGIGFDPEQQQSRGLGLISMGERMRLAGGLFSIWSRPSLGTQVEAIAPATSREALVA